MNIYTKLTLLCLGLVIASGSILFYFTNLQFEKTLRQEITSAIEQQADQSISNLERFIISRINDLEVAAKNPYFQDTTISVNEIISRLQELERSNELYYSFSLFDMNRKRIADSKRLSIGKIHEDNLFWPKLKNNASAMDMSMDESVGRVVLHFSTIVKNDLTGENIGVLVGRIFVNELYDLVGSFALSSDDTRLLNIDLINDQGTIIYSNTNPEGALVDKFSEFDLIKKAKGEKLTESDNSLYVIAKQQSYSEYSGDNWTLVLSISKNLAYAPLTEIQKQLIWVIIPVLLGSIILSLIVAKIFVEPIRKLSKAASEIGKGNLEAHIDIEGKDELGILARELEKTSKILISRIEEQRVLNKKLEEQKDEIILHKNLMESSSKKITDSISYAKRIQRSLLPEIKSLKRLTKDAMILYIPKDVVSGDFYWFERVRKGRSDYLIIAAADCTGHGVPGAIMSIMGSNQLTNIVYYQNYLDPKKILARLDKVIKFELYRDEDDTESKKDGMEIGICVINLDDLSAEFSGIGLPMYLIRNNDLQIFKSIKQMAGGMDGEEREVENQIFKENIQLEVGDRIYLASDGFQDQFGGPDDKKFMAKNFRNLLVDTSHKTLSEQEDSLKDTFNEWKKDTEQTDDIIVLGIEI